MGEVTLQDVADRVDDVARALARQAATLDGLADGRRAEGPDVRLLVGRGGTVVAPAVGAAFDARTMEAVEIVPTAEEAADRTVAMLLEQGLSVGPRSVRPARVAVHKLAP